MSLLAVNHHYYREISPDGGYYPISSALFTAEVELLRRKRRSLGQHELLDLIADSGTESGLIDTFILTFDDGLKEQMAALRDLEKLGISALFFVPTAPLTEKKVLDVHKLHLIRAVRTDVVLLADLEKHFPVALRRLDEDAAARQYRYDNDSARRVKFLLNFVLDTEERRDWIDRVFVAVVGNEVVVATKLYMDREDIRLLGKKKMLGTHAHHHVPLAQLSYDKILRDMSLSLDILTEVSGETVKGISFPYGGPDSVSDLVVKACFSLDLSFGFTMQRGSNEISDFLTPFRLKRIDCNDVAKYT